VDVGASKVETDQDATLDKIYAAARKKVGDATDDFILLPTDVAVAKSVDADQPREERAIDGIASNELALDIGSKTIDRYCSELEAAQSVIWNGTMGMAELQNFAHGSARVALTLATHPKITSIVGGGDTADFVLKWDAKEGGSFTHVSTGGGASLDLMAGKKLPGIESLMDA
jgi:phosphoglycerate kinase